jgi:hypothetical protein
MEWTADSDKDVQPIVDGEKVDEYDDEQKSEP